MKICVDIRSLDSRLITGVPEYVRLLVENLIREAPQEDFIFFANSFGRRLEKTDLLQKQRRDWINFGIPNRIFDLTSRFLNAPKIDSLVKADVFLSPHFNILALKNPVKRALIIHDISFAHFPEFFPARKRFWHWQQNWQKQIRTAGQIIVNTEYTRQDVIRTLGISGEKVERIRPGINPFYRKIPANDAGLLKFKNEKSLNRPFILSVGTLEPRKNIIATIQAFNYLKQSPSSRDFELIIAGSYGWLYEDILKEIGRSPYRDGIRIWGRATNEEARYLYNLASVFSFPSFFEGIGFPPLEAQICGLPVVASNRSSLPEVLRDSALLVDPWRVSELALAIEAIVKEPKLKENLIEKGFENAARFNWASAAKEVVAILKKQAALAKNA
ncbi:MAG: glycosyltransferase family 1 protein [Minisyncoccia bacterium]